MKTKKTVIAVFTVTLLLSAALISGCLNPLEVISDKDADYNIPAGKGVIKLNIGGSNGARTIFPDGMTAKLSNMVYDIIWTGTAPLNANDDMLEKVNITKASAPIDLDADTYTVSIIAYDADTWDDGDGTELIVAQWDNTLAIKTGTPGGLGDYNYSAGIPVTSGSTAVDVNLVGMLSGGDGTFAYSITTTAFDAINSTDLFTVREYTSQSIDVKTFPGNTGGFYDEFSDDDTAGVYSDSVDLPAGVYMVTVKLVANNCQDRVVQTLIHVYPSMTTTFNTASTPSANITVPNQNLFTVRFDASDVDTSFGTSGILDKDGIENAKAIPDPGTPLDPSSVDVFDGWWTAKSGGTKWLPGTDRAFKDRLLYAHWKPDTSGGGGDVTVTISFDVSDPIHIANTSTATSLTDIETGGKVLEFTLSGVTSAVWTLGGQNLTSLVVSNVLTIDEDTNSDILASIFTTGEQYLIVTGLLDGKYYSETITIVVANAENK
jgi:hypothetical protein